MLVSAICITYLQHLVCQTSPWSALISGVRKD
jgi:hypothetical protein